MEKRKYKNDVSGIYMIKNIINGKMYIGRSCNINKRFSIHKSDLRKNKHINKYFQNAWNKYGEENFEFSILEKVDDNRKKLVNKEQFFLDLYKSYDRKKGYNISKRADNADRGKRSKVLQYDLEGNFIKEFESVSKAQRVLGMSNGGINLVCVGKKKSANGFFWMYKKSKKIEKKIHIEIKSTNKKIYQYNLGGSFIKEWKNAKEISLYYKCEQSAIVQTCKKKYKTYISYIWRFKCDIKNRNKKINKEEFENNNLVPVLQYDLNGNFIKEHHSTSHASREVKVGVSTITNVCRGVHKITGGFIWRYKSDVENINEKIDIKYLKNAKYYKICQYDLEGKFIKIWNSLNELCDELGYDNSLISKFCKNKEINNSSYGYIWRFYESEEQLLDIKKEKIKSWIKKVYQYDLKENFIAEFNSVLEVNKIFNFSKSSIRNSCSGISNTSYGFKWSYNKL